MLVVAIEAATAAWGLGGGGLGLSYVTSNKSLGVGLLGGLGGFWSTRSLCWVSAWLKRTSAAISMHHVPLLHLEFEDCGASGTKSAVRPNYVKGPRDFSAACLHRPVNNA